MNVLEFLMPLNAGPGFWGWMFLHLLLIWLALYPLAILRSYIKSGGNVTIYSRRIPPEGNVRRVHSVRDAYVLFLSGVGRVSSRTHSLREKGILERLANRCPTAVVLDDVFAYSINNMPLTENRRLSVVWRWAMRQKLKKRHIHGWLGYLINFRNIIHIAISGDVRYARVYNRGFARVLIHHLEQYGYDLKQPKPLFIVSYSGAGQVAAGAVKHLRQEYDLPVYALMLACFFTEGPGVVAANHIWEFIGTMDRAYDFCYTFTPSRWLRFGRNTWSRYVRNGGITRIDMGAMKHTGRGGYLDQNSLLPNGVCYIDFTAEQFASIINRISARHAREHTA